MQTHCERSAGPALGAWRALEEVVPVRGPRGTWPGGETEARCPGPVCRLFLMKTPLFIQVTSPVRPSGQLSHDAVNYIREEEFVSCGYVFSLLKLVWKKEREVCGACVSYRLPASPAGLGPVMIVPFVVFSCTIKAWGGERAGALFRPCRCAQDRGVMQWPWGPALLPAPSPYSVQG